MSLLVRVRALLRRCFCGFPTTLSRYLMCFLRYDFSMFKRFVKYSHVFAYFIRFLKSLLVMKNTSAIAEFHIQLTSLLVLFMTSSSPKWSLSVLIPICNTESPCFFVNLKSPFIIKYTPSESSPCLYTNYPFLYLFSLRWYVIRRRCNVVHPSKAGRLLRYANFLLERPCVTEANIVLKLCRSNVNKYVSSIAIIVAERGLFSIKLISPKLSPA